MIIYYILFMIILGELIEKFLATLLASVEANWGVRALPEAKILSSL